MKFFKFFLLASLIIFIVFLSGCKTEGSDEGTSIIVYLYNSTQKTIGVIFLESNGSMLTIKVSDFNTTGVDPNRIAVKRSDGSHLGYSNTGSVNISTNNFSGSVDAYVFNNYPGLEYAHFEQYTSKVGKREVTWHHEDRDGFVSDEAYVKSIMNKVHNLLLGYGSFTKVSFGGDRGVGYSDCAGNAGKATYTWFGVNPIKAGTSNIENTFFEEAFETLGGFDDIPNLRWNNFDTELLKHVMSFIYLKSGM